MLVLSRKTGQKIIINDNIEVTILETKGDTVRIGVNAPKNVTIYREELYQEIKSANLQSSVGINLDDISLAANMFSSKTEKPVYSDKLNKLLKDKTPKQ